MINIGEKLNSSIPKTLEALNNNDRDYIITLIKAQSEAGAEYLDINTALCGDKELEKMIEVIELVKEYSDCGIMLDSPAPAVIIAAAEKCEGRKLIFNSVTLNERLEELCPAALKYNAGIVGLPIDENGIPSTVEKRVSNSFRLITALREKGIPIDDIYIDVLVETLSVDSENAMITLETTRRLKETFPKIKTICGLSNISFGLPKRVHINEAFMAMAAFCGLDAAITDVTSKPLQIAQKSALALTGEDEYCMEYIGFMREVYSL